MQLDLDKTLQTIKERQWSLADFDWNEPGAELITPEQWSTVKEFMSDLVWIEQVGSRSFAALALNAQDETLTEIYRYFQAEEQKHANAELALMRRWGMLDGDEIPQPNSNIRLSMNWLDRNADDLPLSTLASTIPLLEVALDGALLKFLLDEVKDPLCHKVFQKINADESRHLAVDFHVLEMVGAGRIRRVMIESAATLVRPSVIFGLLLSLPLLSRMRQNVVRMGLSEKRLLDAIGRFSTVGDRSANIRRNPLYRAVRFYGGLVMDSSHPYHRLIGNKLLWLTSNVPERLLPKRPTWSDELTYEPVAS
jgi:hypothetical protein